jgi:hypothetical protein
MAAFWYFLDLFLGYFIHDENTQAGVNSHLQIETSVARYKFPCI